MGCNDASCSFEPMRLQRRQPTEYDVVIDMKYCGVCHSDLHFAAGHLEDQWGKIERPCVPGHELAGVVKEVGSAVTKFKVGDHIGVGCMVDSCMDCAGCNQGFEQNCSKMVLTYAGPDWSGRAATPNRTTTLGGYTTVMVVHERFGIQIPKGFPLEMAGPVMCAGITMYDPMKVYGAKEGSKVGIVGLGGLGVTGLKIGKALGCEIWAISRSEGKRSFAMDKCGASGYIASGDEKQLETHKASFDLIINTIPKDHDTSIYTRMCKSSGHHVLLGLHATAFAAQRLGSFGRKVRFSIIGGIPNTQEVMDLCAKHKIYPEIEVHSVTELNRIYEKLDSSNDSGKRYVLDIQGTLNDATFSKSMGAPTKLGPDQDKVGFASILMRMIGLLCGTK